MALLKVTIACSADKANYCLILVTTWLLQLCM